LENEKGYGNTAIVLTKLVLPARIEPAAHGLGILKPGHIGTNKDKKINKNFK